MNDHELAQRIHEILKKDFPEADGVATNIVKAARHTGLMVSEGLGMVEQESRFQNIYGHDPTIFAGHGRVTRDNYHEYLARRGHTRMQGVGYTQLTWWEYQDEADKLGGCWKPYPNLVVGFRALGANVARWGLHKGLAIYNGGAGNPNYDYAHEVERRIDRWHGQLT
jgi:hypothetical protein